MLVRWSFARGQKEAVCKRNTARTDNAARPVSSVSASSTDECQLLGGMCCKTIFTGHAMAHPVNRNACHTMVEAAEMRDAVSSSQFWEIAMTNNKTCSQTLSKSSCRVIFSTFLFGIFLNATNRCDI